jgi:hypothetical protein
LHSGHAGRLGRGGEKSTGKDAIELNTLDGKKEILGAGDRTLENASRRFTHGIAILARKNNSSSLPKINT